MLSRNSREPLPSQILIPAAARGSDDVLLQMNHRSSATTARRKTRFVVRRGRMGVGVAQESDEGRERENRSWGGAKMERVPVPVLTTM